MTTININHMISDGTNFREVIPEPNIMTPVVMCYYSNGKVEVEIATGRGFDNERIYGITVVHHEYGKLTHLDGLEFDYQLTRERVAEILMMSNYEESEN